ncbi:hypothetical protein IE53DRAFT_311553 [Violaceomyces palustris]|uniref:Uncharacterized protein n=1 Tax=Violaceomyces palustris TaxID=1673888 RepID=A0ACD0P3Z8_9BASI|nr:hypothetical protein IE53DRAFT_311553 [Violaceomyces palustris]
MARGSAKYNNRGGGRGRGRGRGRGGGRNRGGAGRGDSNSESKNPSDSGWGARGTYTPADQHNKKLEAYYIDQKILEPSEWSAFLESMKAPLPTTFRITSGKHTTSQLLKAMNDIYLPFLSNVTFEGEKVNPPKQLPWYPEGLGWHLNTKKTVIRKSPEFKRFHQFLVHETEVGSISRQEAVSMLPPLFLDVRPDHLVLDMCAAPGSKTAQLIEALHSPVTTSPDSYEPMPAGLVIANDSDTKRAHMLVHQSQRLPSPNLIVSNLDASRYPSVKVHHKGAEPDSEVCQKPLEFDRILADVPCSGDGTIRKNLTIWKDWTPSNAVGLHALQLKILMKGLSLLRAGGRLVYSTCSMNPIENESVVAEALRLSKGSVRLVDCSSQLPQLVRRPGLTTWKAAPGKGAHLFKKSEDILAKEAAAAAAAAAAATASDEGATEAVEEKKEEEETGEEEAEAEAEVEEDEETEAIQPGSEAYRAKLPQVAWIESWDELNVLDPELASRTPASIWPKGDEKELGIEHCMRVYPHLQDTGGFFVAVLEKEGDKEAESMSAGMIRAMKAMDSAGVTPAEAEIPASSVKRELSPSSDDVESPAVKRIKEEGGDQVDSLVATPTASSANGEDTHVKPDKHAADKAASKLAKLPANDGHGMPGGLPYKEDPMAYVPHTNEQIQSCLKFFQLLPSFEPRNLLVRNSEHLPLRSVYLTSTSARALITAGGPGRGSHPHMNPILMRLINCGIKSLGRQDAGKDATLECKWRIISDGLGAIRPHIEESAIIPIQLSDLAFLIAHHYPMMSNVPGELAEVMRGKKIGSHVVDVLPSEHLGHKLESKMSFPVWRAAASINLMLDKQEKSALSFRLFDTDLSNPDGGRQIAGPRPEKKKKDQGEAAEQVDTEMALADAEDELRSKTTMSSSKPINPPSVQLEPYQSEYIQLALDSNILRFDGPFTLKSGRSSPYFFNAGLFNSGSKIQKVAECYANKIVESRVEFDVLFGPAYKGIPLAAATAMALNQKHGIDVGFCFNRKEAKTHGEGGSLVGAPLKGKVLILDDVITAGTAINEAMEIILGQEGAQLAGVVIALDRQEKSGKDGVVGETSAIVEVERKYQTRVLSVVNLDQIIEFMVRNGAESRKKEIESMVEYRRRYGVSELA